MSTIKQLLLLYLQGKKKKTIASIVGISKNTVKNYQHKLEALLADNAHPISIEALPKLEHPVLEAIFHAGNPA